MSSNASLAAPRFTSLFSQLGVAALYFLFGHIMHQLFTMQSIVSVVWPSAGLALGAVLIGGRRYLWGVLLGSLALNIYANDSIWAICGITLADITNVWLGIWLIERFYPGARNQRNLLDYLWLIALGGATAGIAGAFIGSMSIKLAGYIEWADLAENFGHWWMGDVLGVVLLTPFMLSIHHDRLTKAVKYPSLEGVLLIVVTFFAGQIIFINWLNFDLIDVPLDYLMFLCVTLVAIRMGTTGTSFVILMIAIQAMFGVYLKVGVFANDIKLISLHNYWAYMMVLSLVGMTMSLFVNGIQRIVSALRLKDSALNAAANSIIITDAQGRIEWANQSFSRASGYDQDEILGRTPGNLVKSGKHDPDFYSVMWNTILANKVWHGEVVNRRKDGALFDEEMTITPIGGKAGGITHFIAVKQDVSRRKAIERELAVSEERTRLAISASNSALWDYDLTSGKVYLSESWSTFLGEEPHTTVISPEALIQLVHPDEVEHVRNSFINALKGKDNTEYETTHRVRKIDGDYIWIVSRGSVTERDQNGLALRMTGINRDITERKRAQDALHESEEKLRGLFELSPLGIALTDMDGRYIEFNEAFRQICGYPKEELLTLDYWTLTPKKYEADEVRQLELLRSVGHYGPYEKEYVRKDGTHVPIQLTGMLVTGKDGKHYIWSIVENISERKRMEEKIRELAFYDALTKLPNRRLMHDRLVQIMTASKRSGHYAALMILDLDNFKPLNDQHGHGAGDLLLIEVANRLQKCLRAVDTVARFGGDEFVVMLSELDSEREESCSQAGIIAEKIRHALSQPYFLRVYKDNNTGTVIEHRCTTSIGVELFIGHEPGLQEILQHADAAMYRAKELGKNQIQFYQQ